MIESFPQKILADDDDFSLSRMDQMLSRMDQKYEFDSFRVHARLEVASTAKNNLHITDPLFSVFFMKLNHL